MISIIRNKFANYGLLYGLLGLILGLLAGYYAFKVSKNMFYDNKERRMKRYSLCIEDLNTFGLNEKNIEKHTSDCIRRYVTYVDRL